MYPLNKKPLPLGKEAAVLLGVQLKNAFVGSFFDREASNKKYMNPQVISTQDAMALIMKEKRRNQDYINHGSPSAIIELCSSGLTILCPYNSLTCAVFDSIDACMEFAQDEEKIDSIRVACYLEKVRDKILNIEHTWPEFVAELADIIGRDIAVHIETDYLNVLSADLKRYGQKRIANDDVFYLLTIYLYAVLKAVVNGKWVLDIEGYEGYKYTFYYPYIVDEDGNKYRLTRYLHKSLASKYPKFDLCEIIKNSTVLDNIDTSGEVIFKIPGITLESKFRPPI